MSKHTAGPWHIGQILWESAPEILDEKQNLVATVPRAQYVDNLEAQANARLIAAAPDLLAACKEAERTIRGLLLAISINRRAAANSVVNILRDAIATAEASRAQEPA